MLTLNEQIAAAEAVLFAAGEPVPMESLMAGLDLNALEFEPVLQGLREKYGRDSGLRLMRYDDSLQLTTRPEYMERIERVLQPVRRQSLTQAALETLSVIAYRQPITRMEIEQIRGVQCERALYTLSNHGLIAEVGRKDAIGRPILYGTTEKFLQHFALSSLNELPTLIDEAQLQEDFGNL